MPQTPFGTGAVGQIAQDTFEKLKDQAQDVPNAIRDAVTGEDSSDSGMEQVSGQQDPQQPPFAKASAGKPGLTPQQLAEKQAEEQQAMKYHRSYIQQVDQEQARLRQEAEMKKKQEAEQEQAKKQQEIVELQEEQVKSAALGSQKSSKPTGPGSAFMQQSTKSQTEFSKQATQ